MTHNYDFTSSVSIILDVYIIDLVINLYSIRSSDFE